MHPIKTVLLIEDNPGDARLLREMFAEQGSGDEQLTCVESMSEAEKYLAKHSVDIILLDLGLPIRKVWKRSGVRKSQRPESPWWC